MGEYQLSERYNFSKVERPWPDIENRVQKTFHHAGFSSIMCEIGVLPALRYFLPVVVNNVMEEEFLHVPLGIHEPWAIYSFAYF